MKTRQLLATAATVVLIGGGIATAQDVKKDEHLTQVPSAQRHAPAEKIAPPITQGASKTPETTGQSTLKAEPDAVPHATDNATRSGLNSKDDLKGKQHSDTSNDANASATNANQEKSGANVAASSKAETRSTTGQGSAAGAAKLTAEQRTKITTIFQKHKVAPVRLNASATVGTRISSSMHFYPIPAEVIAIYPEWRGYDYVMVGDKILVIEPGTHEIVVVLSA